MSRKRHGGVLGDLFEIAAMLPWWIGAALAIGAFVVFHSIATEDEAATGPAWFGAMDMGHPWQTLAAFLQYLLPLLLLFGALASAIADDRRRTSSEDATESEPAAQPPLD